MIEIGNYTVTNTYVSFDLLLYLQIESMLNINFIISFHETI